MNRIQFHHPAHLIRHMAAALAERAGLLQAEEPRDG